MSRRQQRYDSVRDHEWQLARNGTVILKFWFNVSKEDHRKEFLECIRVEKKNWKFFKGDLEERKLWKKYLSTYR